jgi:hypothetical protein
MRLPTGTTTLILLAALGVLAGGAPPPAFGAPDTSSVAHAMKGWALYTWLDPECGPQLESAIEPKLCYALVPATNRTHSAEEIAKARLGFEALEAQLERLPAGESIGWNNASALTGRLPLAMPSEARTKQILELARAHGLTIEIVPPTRPLNGR